MSNSFHSSPVTSLDKKEAAHTEPRDVASSEISIDLHKELYDSSVVDPSLAKKMALVNSAIDEIGMTPFQWKLFFLNGFGYAVDSVSQAPFPSCAH